MYSHYCRGCGRHYESVSMNDVYCSAGCLNIHRESTKQQSNYNESYSSNSHSNSNSYGGNSGVIPIELILFGIVGCIGYIAWESIRNWHLFEPVTRHILLVLHYIIYKPLHFSTNIHAYLSNVEDIHDLGLWFFALKWLVLLLYILFIFSIYILIVEELNKKRLTWLWVLALIAPLITHGIWYFFIR